MMKAVLGLFLLTSGCFANEVETPVELFTEFSKDFELMEHGPKFEGHGAGSGVHIRVGHAEDAPNYIFFMPDELRADVLGCYGGEAITPNFDRLAKSGVRFEQTSVSNPVCAQSRAALMTGWPTHVAGHRTLNSLLHRDEPNMLRYFKQNGYEVRWWGKNDVLAADAFQGSVDSASSPGGSVRQGEQKGSKYSFLYGAFEGEQATSDSNSVQEAINFLKSHKKGSKPFVLFLPLGMPHPPYSAPQRFQQMYNNMTVDLRSHELAKKPEFHSLIRKYHKFNTMGESDYSKMLLQVRQTYLAMVSYTDSLLGRILDTVDKSDLKDNTAIISFSDHGDYAGDYGLVEKWPSGMEDILTQVPLIARIPKVTDHNMGNTWKEPVQLFDIMPTVMEVSGIQVAHTHFAKSLVKQMMGTANPKQHGRKYVFAEGGFASFEPRDLESDCDQAHKPCAPLGTNYYPKLLQQQEHPESVARAIMVRSKTHKLIWRNDPEYGEKDCEIYDLLKDPKEMANKWDDPEYSGVKAELKDALLHWLSQTSDITPFQKDPRDSYPGVIQTQQKVEGSQAPDVHPGKGQNPVKNLVKKLQKSQKGHKFNEVLKDHEGQEVDSLVEEDKHAAEKKPVVHKLAPKKQAHKHHKKADGVRMPYWR